MIPDTGTIALTPAAEEIRHLPGWKVPITRGGGFVGSHIDLASLMIEVSGSRSTMELREGFAKPSTGSAT